jgi:hypothetical protein
MPDPIKQKYYRENREKRLAYQRAYYERYKAVLPRRRELEELLEPEECEARKQARSAYNKEYYLTNRERICKQRAEFRRKQKVAKLAQVTEGQPVSEIRGSISDSVISLPNIVSPCGEKGGISESASCERGA